MDNGFNPVNIDRQVVVVNHRKEIFLVNVIGKS